MTLGQVEAFLPEVDKADRAARRTDLIVARTAQAKPKYYQQLLKEFEDGR
ncbi:hypothetical protein [Pseudomonas nicosulfuronedens]